MRGHERGVSHQVGGEGKAALNAFEITYTVELTCPAPQHPNPRLRYGVSTLRPPTDPAEELRPQQAKMHTRARLPMIRWIRNL